MNEAQAKELLDKIIGQVFGYQNPLSLEQFMQKFTFDIKLPQQVVDAVDGSVTWAQSTNPTKFMKMENARNAEIGGASTATDGLRPKRALNSMDDIIAAWGEINFMTTERHIESLNVGQSDNIIRSENVFRSQDIRTCKNVLFSDGVSSCEYVAACQRSANSTFCVRVDDSGDCSNSFNVAWSSKISNSFFISDAADMQDSMFCTNIKGKRFCIANMEYTEQEYNHYKEMVIRWILTG